jgi:xanthine dehydrogenase molybdopterin-binding subunit B
MLHFNLLIGEPPLFLGASVFFALRDAANYARKFNNIQEPRSFFY